MYDRPCYSISKIIVSSQGDRGQPGYPGEQGIQGEPVSIYE